MMSLAFGKIGAYAEVPGGAGNTPGAALRKGPPEMQQQFIPPRLCVVCGVALARRRGEAPCRFALRQTCGKACGGILGKEARYASGQWPRRVLLACTHCGKAFSERPSHLVSYYGHQRQFCSRACKDAAKRGATKPIEETQRTVFICQECGAEGLQWPSVTRKYCSRSCANIANNRQRNRAKSTSIERAVYAALDELGIVYLPQHPLGWMLVDAYLPDLNIVIECQGDFFHCNPALYPEGPVSDIQRQVMGRDAARRKWLAHRGYHLVELWESDITAIGAKALIEGRVLS